MLLNHLNSRVLIFGTGLDQHVRSSFNIRAGIRLSDKNPQPENVLHVV